MRIRRRIWIPAAAVLVAVSIPVALWYTSVSDYNNLPYCPKSIESEPEAANPFTDITGPEDDTTPEFGRVLTAAGMTLTAYQDLAFDSISGYGSSPDGENITRLIKADGSGYQEIPVPKVLDYSVAPDRKQAAIVENVGDTGKVEAAPRLGIQDLGTGTLEWLPLTEQATLAAWSPIEDTILVATEKPGKLFLVNPAGGEPKTITVSAPIGNQVLTSIMWQPHGQSFIATAAPNEDAWESAEVKLDGSVSQLPVAVSGIGLSPSGSKSGVRFDDSPSSKIVDVESGKVITGTGYGACTTDGNVHEFEAQAWIDDYRLIAIEFDNEWEGDKRWGESGHVPRGNRLVIVDLDGAVHEALTEWGVVLPAVMHFTKDFRAPAATQTD